jgi:hypothetical protein
MKRKLSETVKKQVAFEQEYKCDKCKCLLPPSYQIDHIIPHCISGDDSRENLVALCPNCHATKTQQERKRIVYFKKRSVIEKCKLCYFCFEPITLEHRCDKIYKPINEKKEYKPISNLYKYAMTNDTELSALSNLTINDDVLRITVTREYVHVNNYFTKVIDENLTPADLGEIVREATKLTKKKFSNVKIYIIVKNRGGIGGEECVKYFSNILPEMIPNDIFNINKDKIKYEYHVNEN